LSHSESMGSGWEDRGSLAWLVDGDEFQRERNDGGTSRHEASGGEVLRWRSRKLSKAAMWLEEDRGWLSMVSPLLTEGGR
jgi:hypothetical protein